MFKLFLASFALALVSGMAQAETYKCNIETYGRPVNFAGSYQKQKELMKSWMPYKEYYILTDGDTVVMHHSGDLKIPARVVNQDTSPVVYVFRDYPYATGGNSRFRDTRIALDLSDGSFSLKLNMNPGTRYRKSGGSSFGHCKAI